MDELLYSVLDAALTGVHVSPGPSAVSSILASTTAGDKQQATLEGLSTVQIVRAYMYAAAASKQAHAVLVDIQSAAAVYPATVPLLLHAMNSQQRHQLQETLLDLSQQQQHLMQLELQKQQDQLPMPNAAAAALDDVQLQPWVRQLSHLGVWDVLLLLGLLGDQQWEADASMVLLTGMKDMTSLQQLSELFRDLSTVSDGAADWMLGVGLKWATTCYIDMQIDGASFEQAGTWLLKAGIWATPQLAQQGMQQVLQQLTADSSASSSVWQVLQYVVVRCIRTYQQQQQEAVAAQQQHVQQQRTCDLGVLDGSGDNWYDTRSPDAAVAAVCVQQMLGQLSQMLMRPATTAALQYVSCIQPLASVRCDAMHALVAAAGSVLLPGSGLGQQQQWWLEQYQIKQEQLMIKQEVQEGDALRGETAEAAAAVAALASGRADAGAATAGTAAAGVAGSGRGYGLLRPPAQQGTQQKEKHRPSSRYTWGFGRYRGSQSVADDTAVDSSLQHQQQQQTPSTYTVPGVSRAPPVWSATATQEYTTAAAATMPVRELTPSPPGVVLPFLSPATTPSLSQNGGTQSTPLSATYPAPAAQHQYQLQVFDAAASSKTLKRLLCQVAGVNTVGGSSSSSNTTGLQHMPAGAAHDVSGLAPTDRLTVALLCAVLQRATPCSSNCCQQQVTAAVQQVMGQMTPSAIQYLAQRCQQCAQQTVHVPEQEQKQHSQAGSAMPRTTASLSTPIGDRASAAAGATPAISTPSAGVGGASEVPPTPNDGSSSTSNTVCWPMESCWQQAILHLLQQQVQLLLSGSAVVAQDLPSRQDSAGGGDDGISKTHNQLAALPIVLKIVLDALPADSTSGVSEPPAALREQGQQQEGYHRQHAGQAVVDPVVASLLGQLLCKLLEHQPQQAMAATAASSRVESCAAAVRDLLVRHHTLSLLLQFMLQQPAAGQQLIAAAVNSGTLCLGCAAQQKCDDSHLLAAGTAAAAEGAAVEVDGMQATSEQQQLQHQEQQQQDAAVAGSPAEAGVDIRRKMANVVVTMALQLQHLQALLLPNALQQLLAAHTTAFINKQQQQKRPQHKQQTPAGAVTPGSQAAKGSAQQLAGVSKQNRTSCPFFVVHTPAEKKPAAEDSSQQQQLVDSHTSAAENDAGASKGRQVQLLPACLLQLLVLPLSVCQLLLQTAADELGPILNQLCHQQEQQKQQVHSRKSAVLQSVGGSTGFSSRRARRSSCAAAAGGGGAPAQHADGKAAGDSSMPAQAGPFGGGGAIEAAVSTEPLLEVGLASQQAAAADMITNSGMCLSSNRSASTAAALHRVLQLLDVALVSLLAWVDHQSEDSLCGTHVQSATQQSSAAARAAYDSALLLLQLHNKLSVVSQALVRPQEHDLLLPSMMHQTQEQQTAGQASIALSTAAHLLECWWAATALNSRSMGSIHQHQQQQQQQQLEEYLKHLAASLAATSPCGMAGEGGVSSGSLSWSVVGAVFGHGLGSNKWAVMKRLQQQETLLAVMLDLMIRIHYLAHNQRSEEQPAAVPPAPPAAAAPTAMGCGPSKAHQCSAAAEMTSLLQQLAVLSAVAEDVYNPAAATGAAAAAGDARWLLTLLATKAQELVLGQMLTPAMICTPAAVSALVKLTQPSYLRTLTTAHHTPKPHSPNPPSTTLALSAHLLCMHHSPRVYAAADTSIWGRQGLAVGPGAGPAWVVGCSRDLATAAAREMLRLLTQEVQGPGSCTVANHQEAPEAPAAAAAGGVCAGLELPPSRQSAQVWQSRAAAVAATCDCCELLLYQQALQARRQHQQQKQQARLCTSTFRRKASSKNHCVDSNNNSSTGIEDDASADLQLVVKALAAVLGGPCTTAAAHMAALLHWRMQQQHQDPEPHDTDQARSYASFSQDQPAAAGAAADATAQVCHSSRSRRREAKRQQRRAAAAAAADPCTQLQTQLSLLLGLGCAAGRLVLTRRDQLLQSQQGQQQQQLAGIEAKAPIRELLQELRAFSSAYQQLLQVINQAAAAAAEVDDCDRPHPAKAVGDALEPTTEYCAVQSRKDAWAAVAAAAAVLEGSSSDDSDSDEDEDQEVHVGKMPEQQEGTGCNAAAAADPASRFYDPDVHEELLLTDDDGGGDSALSDSDEEEGAAAGWDGEHNKNPQKREECGGPLQQQGDEQGAVDRPDRNAACQQQPQSRLLLRKVFNSHPAAVASQQRWQQSGRRAQAHEEPLHKEPVQLKQSPRIRKQQQQLHQQQPQATAGTAAAAVAAARAAAAKARSTRKQQSGPVPIAPAAPAAAMPKLASGDCAVPVSAAAAAAAAGPGGGPADTPVPPRRGRGRPRKYPLAPPQAEQQATVSTGAEAEALLTAATPPTATKAGGKAGQVAGSTTPKTPGPAAQPSSAAVSPQQQQVVSIMCGDQRGIFDAGSQHVTTADGTVMTPTAFERLGGKGTFKKWKNSLHVVRDDGQQGVRLARWLSAAGVETDAGGAVSGNEKQCTPMQQAGKKQSQVDAAGAAAAVGEAAAGDCEGPDASDSARPYKKRKKTPPAAGSSGVLIAGASAAAQASREQQQRQQQQQDQQPAGNPRRRVVPVPVTPSDAHKQQQQQADGANQAWGRQKQRVPALAASTDTNRARNAFVQAALAESQGVAYSTDEDSEDDSDYSDLEDFIVVQPGKDYSKVLAEVGGRVSWKQKWQQVPGRVRGEQR